MKEFLEAISSRKLWLVVGGIATILGTPGLTPVQRMEGIVTLITGYVAGQGFVDGMAAHGSDKTDAEIEAATKDNKPPSGA